MDIIENLSHLLHPGFSGTHLMLDVKFNPFDMVL